MPVTGPSRASPPVSADHDGRAGLRRRCHARRNQRPGRRAGPEHGAGRRLALLLRVAYGAAIEAAVKKAGLADALEPPLEAAERDAMLRAGPDDRSDNPSDNPAGE